LAFAVFGVTIYAISQSWSSIKNFFKPHVYASDPVKGPTDFEKNFPNVAEAIDKIKNSLPAFNLFPSLFKWFKK